jgi:hypothetical protein
MKVIFILFRDIFLLDIPSEDEVKNYEKNFNPYDENFLKRKHEIYDGEIFISPNISDVNKNENVVKPNNYLNINIISDNSSSESVLTTKIAKHKFFYETSISSLFIL